MQSKLKQFAKTLGYEGSEIFPKQTEILVERGDTGNFLNLPYYNNTKGLRYAFDDNGNALTLEQFYMRMINIVAPEEMLKEYKSQLKKEKRPFH